MTGPAGPVATLPFVLLVFMLCLFAGIMGNRVGRAWLGLFMPTCQ
jgi:hypothetical protein